MQAALERHVLPEDESPMPLLNELVGGCERRQARRLIRHRRPRHAGRRQKGCLLIGHRQRHLLSVGSPAAMLAGFHQCSGGQEAAVDVAGPQNIGLGRGGGGQQSFGLPSLGAQCHLDRLGLASDDRTIVHGQPRQLAPGPLGQGLASLSSQLDAHSPQRPMLERCQQGQRQEPDGQ